MATPNFAIEAFDLCKEYPGTTALKDFSLQVRPGTIHGLLGLNGAGKTTTMNILSGLMRATAGRVVIHGEENPDLCRHHNTIGHLPEVPPLYGDMVVQDYLEFCGQIHGLRRAQVQTQIKVLSARCGVAGLAQRLIGNLSKGQRQKVALLSVLLYDPAILILDEPTVGLDPVSLVEIRQLICELGKTKTILLSSHQLREVQEICQEITIVHQGRRLFSGTVTQAADQLRSSEVVLALVRFWPAEVQAQLERMAGILEVEVHPLERDFSLRIHLASGGPDRRAQLTQFLVEHHCQLLSFQMEERSLEEIFLTMTKRGRP